MVGLRRLWHAVCIIGAIAAASGTPAAIESGNLHLCSLQHTSIHSDTPALHASQGLPIHCHQCCTPTDEPGSVSSPCSRCA